VFGSSNRRKYDWKDFNRSEELVEGVSQPTLTLYINPQATPASVVAIQPVQI
jgi:hypothetical protein